MTPNLLHKIKLANNYQQIIKSFRKEKRQQNRLMWINRVIAT